MPTADQVIQELSAGCMSFPPLTLCVLADANRAQDRVLQARWGDRRFEFDIEYKPFATPKLIREATTEAQRRARASGRVPLVIAPYLSDVQLSELESAGVSGIDLSGNGVITIPGAILIYRTGSPNRFPASAPIRNVFRGTSSLVGRTLLLTPSFNTVTEVLEQVRRRGGQTTLPTVSKVLSALDEELIVDRTDGIRVIQPAKLLDRLRTEFRPPTIDRRATVQVAGGPVALLARIQQATGDREIRLTATGSTSAPQYATVARGDLPALYCTDVSGVLSTPGVTEVRRFADLELIETRDPTVYFDPRTEDGFPWASPIQAYLELSVGDKRDQETAEQIRRLLLELRG